VKGGRKGTSKKCLLVGEEDGRRLRHLWGHSNIKKKTGTETRKGGRERRRWQGEIPATLKPGGRGSSLLWKKLDVGEDTLARGGGEGGGGGAAATALKLHLLSCGRDL